MERHELSGGQFVTGSMEESLDYMQKRTDSAMSELFPEQKALLEGDKEWFWFQIRPGHHPTGELPIYGHAWSEEYAAKSELEAMGAERVDQLSNEDLAEFKWTRQRLSESRKSGYIFGRAYSMAEPEGELGSTHISEMWPITKEAFEEARRNGWRPLRDASPLIMTAFRQFVIRWVETAPDVSVASGDRKPKTEEGK